MSLSLRFSSHLLSNTAEALLRNSFSQLRSRFGWILFSVASVLRSFSSLRSLMTRSDLNLALKFLLCLDTIMNLFFHIVFSISDSLRSVRKSVLIYDTIIDFLLHISIQIFHAQGSLFIIFYCTTKMGFACRKIFKISILYFNLLP